MKTRVLIIAGIIVAVTATTGLGVNFMMESANQREQELSQRSLATDSRGNCGEKYLLAGKDECILNPEFIEPNTFIIYDVTQSSGTRLSIAPHDIVMNLTDGNIVNFVNDGANTINIFDYPKEIWRFDDVKPSSQRKITINGTGFYEILVQNSREGEFGDIVALSHDTNSLPVEIRAKMAQSIVGSDFRKGVGLIGVGSGGVEPGITIEIDEKFQDKYDDAEKFYHDKYRQMIPFDVPITIEFTEPPTFVDGK